MSSVKVFPSERKMPLFLPKMSLEDYPWLEEDWGGSPRQDIVEHIAGLTYYLNAMKSKIERLEGRIEELEGDGKVVPLWKNDY
jgi:hypothetical protein